MKVTEEMLYQNAAAARELWLDALLDTCEIPEHIFSANFERKMKKLVRVQRRPVWLNQTLNGLKRVAAVAMAALVIGTAGAMSVEAYRQKIVQVVTEVFHDLTRYHFYNSSTDGYTVIPEVEITYVPEGFELKEERRREERAYYLFENNEGQFIDVDLTLIIPGGSYQMIQNTEDAYVEKFNIGDSEATGTEKEGHSSIFWLVENVRFDLFGNIPLEELKQVAFWISIEETQEIRVPLTVEDGEELIPLYSPAWVPEGFERTYISGSKDDIVLLYEMPDRETGFVVTAFYMDETVTMDVFAGDEDFTREKVTVNGIPGDYYTALKEGDTDCLIWFDEFKGIAFQVDGFLDRETLFRVAESITMK